MKIAHVGNIWNVSLSISDSVCGFPIAETPVQCYLFSHLVVLWNSLSDVPSVRWMWVSACVCQCLHLNARIYSGAERDCQYHTTMNCFYNEHIHNWTDLPQNNILSILPLKALAMWRYINYHFLVRTSSRQQMQGGRGFIIILDHGEACIVLLQFFKKCPFLLTPQMRENSPAISPTNTSTALFGLKPRSGKLKP